MIKMNETEIAQVNQAIAILQAAIAGSPVPVPPTPTPVPPTPTPPNPDDTYPPTVNTTFDFMMNPATAGTNQIIRCNSGESVSLKFNSGPAGTVRNFTVENCIQYQACQKYMTVATTPNTFLPYPDFGPGQLYPTGMSGLFYSWEVQAVEPGQQGTPGYGIVLPNTDYYLNIRNENVAMTEPGVYGGRGIDTAQPGLGLTYGFLFQWH